jgi:hypothetical protein
VRSADEGRRDHKPAAARRQHGVRAFARQALDRIAAEGFAAAAQGTMDLDAQYGEMVAQGRCLLDQALLAGSGKPLYMSRAIIDAHYLRVACALRLAV